MNKSLTHWRKSPHFCGSCYIFFHSSWIRSRKIKENSWKEREKISLQFEPIFITVQCASQLQEFFKWKMMKKSSNWQRILRFSDHYCYSKLAMFGVKTSCKSCSFYLWFITPIFELQLKEIKKLCCQFEWCNRDLILRKNKPNALMGYFHVPSLWRSKTFIHSLSHCWAKSSEITEQTSTCPY